MSKLAYYIKKAFTDKDDETPEIMLILTALSVVCYIVYFGYKILHSPDKANIDTFGHELGLLLAGGGAASHMKRDNMNPQGQ